MAARNYDIITIGGGIAASSFAKAMAERGAMPRSGKMGAHAFSGHIAGRRGITGEGPAADRRRSDAGSRSYF